MATTADPTDPIWADLMQVYAHVHRARRGRGDCYAIVVTDGTGAQLREGLRRARALVDVPNIALVDDGGAAGVPGSGPAILLALTRILVGDPDAVLVVAPAHDALGEDDEFAAAVAAGYVHLARAPGCVVALEGGVLVGRGRALFRLFARAMPRLARLFAFYASTPAREPAAHALH